MLQRPSAAYALRSDQLFLTDQRKLLISRTFSGMLYQRFPGLSLNWGVEIIRSTHIYPYIMNPQLSKSPPVATPAGGQ